MSLPRFFLENQVIADEPQEVFPLRLARDDAKHAKVLRLAPGEHIAVIDAAHDYFECEIASLDGDLPLVRITRHEDATDERPACDTRGRGLPRVRRWIRSFDMRPSSA